MRANPDNIKEETERINDAIMAPEDPADDEDKICLACQ